MNSTALLQVVTTFPTTCYRAASQQLVNKLWVTNLLQLDKTTALLQLVDKLVTSLLRTQLVDKLVQVTSVLRTQLVDKLVQVTSVLRTQLVDKLVQVTSLLRAQPVDKMWECDIAIASNLTSQLIWWEHRTSKPKLTGSKRQNPAVVDLVFLLARSGCHLKQLSNHSCNFPN